MIYLDHAASSPLLPEVLDAMAPWLGAPGNPSSVHRAGQRAAEAVERAREQVAGLVGRAAAGVVFTSGATEANNTALHGLWVRHGVALRLAVSAVEHPSVGEVAFSLAHSGASVHTIPVDDQGRVVVDAIPRDAHAVAVMAVNHETGVIQPIDAVRAALPSAHLHVDATQAAAAMPCDLEPPDTVALSAHKLGGPVGVGALIHRDGAPWPALLRGGPQERGRRAGTVPVASVVGFGAACAIAVTQRDARSARWAAHRARLRAAVEARAGRLVGEHTVPSIACVVFPGVRGDALVHALDLAGVAVSSGAACASGAVAASPVLVAMRDADPGASIRISLGPHSDNDDIDGMIAALDRSLRALRAAIVFD